MAACIVKHDLPLQFCEYEGVKDLFSYLNPDVKVFSRRTTKTDVLNLFSNERKGWSSIWNRFPLGSPLHLIIGLSLILMGLFHLLLITLIIVGLCIRES